MKVKHVIWHAWWTAVAMHSLVVLLMWDGNLWWAVTAVGGVTGRLVIERRVRAEATS